jgi:hypothetical protein
MNIHTKLFWRQSPDSIVSVPADLDGRLGLKNTFSSISFFRSALPTRGVLISESSCLAK